MDLEEADEVYSIDGSNEAYPVDEPSPAFVGPPVFVGPPHELNEVFNELMKERFQSLRETGEGLSIMLNRVKTPEEKTGYLELLERYNRIFAMTFTQLQLYLQKGYTIENSISNGIRFPENLVLFDTE